MQKVFQNSQDLEKKVKQHLSFPDYIMMENAASEICKLIFSLIPTNQAKKIIILCGKGNNGGDGFAVARKLQDYYSVGILYTTEPSASEAKKQFELCKALNIPFISHADFENHCKNADLLLDCLYGTGFHGELSDSDKFLLDAMNKSKGIRVACDIPSALYFNADYTVTMGELKIELFSDKAKAVCGKIITAPLGISTDFFTSFQKPAAYLLEKDDIKLPVRKNKSVHKGNFGHAVTFIGEKAGAGIIGATAALNFGAGFSTLFETEESNLNQFKISPELMITKENLPEKTTSIQIGSGLGIVSESKLNVFTKWFLSTKNPACVIDADLFNFNDIKNLLTKLNDVPEARIVLTPHPKELERILLKLDFNTEETENTKLTISSYFAKTFPNVTLVMKGANTFIASEGNVFICADGNQSLAKAGSGDVLAGLINGLLSQGYTAKDAAITAVMAHAMASSTDEFKDSFALTPEKLINKISEIFVE